MLLSDAKGRFVWRMQEVLDVSGFISFLIVTWTDSYFSVQRRIALHMRVWHCTGEELDGWGLFTFSSTRPTSSSCFCSDLHFTSPLFVICDCGSAFVVWIKMLIWTRRSCSRLCKLRFKGNINQNAGNWNDHLVLAQFQFSAGETLQLKASWNVITNYKLLKGSFCSFLLN